MTITVCGVNHQVAVKERERLAIAPGELADSLHAVLGEPEISEALILSTCNRSEVYCISDNASRVKHWFQNYHQLSAGFMAENTYLHQGGEAVAHLLRVAAGLNSMVLGEPQIFGQLKEAFSVAVSQGAVGSQLQHLLQFAFTTTKRIRHETAIGREAVSIASAAVSLAKCIFSELRPLKVLAVGVGDTSTLALQHFREQGVSEFIIANRTLSNAQQLAADFAATAIALEQIPLHLETVDVVISATSSRQPILPKCWVMDALKSSRRRPMFLVDLAVPRDIEFGVGELDGAYLYNIDDLQQITQDNLRQRIAAAEEAEKIITMETNRYLAKVRERDCSATISAYRDKVAMFREQEVAKALKLIRQGHCPEKVLVGMAHALANKLMHHPSVKMREAGSHGHHEFIAMARRLLDITE